jgi:hypothetical protein
MILPIARGDQARVVELTGIRRDERQLGFLQLSLRYGGRHKTRLRRSKVMTIGSKARKNELVVHDFAGS